MTDSVVGLVLAAGAGRRFGGPKALATDVDGEPWVRRAARRLHEGGCDRVQIVIGAAADQVRAVLDPADHVVESVGWDEGMGASLRSGLSTLTDADVEVGAVVVMLVDLPGVGSDVIARLVARAAPDALARASYDGIPGHPVLLGRDHWAGVIETARGDRGARDYLASHPTTLVECGDIGSAEDVDER